ncbi:family 78 glycoside hydrolase catalytic domain [Evansella sp. AB-rgal1]|uniref:alpha-L-rhamnosidase n=1 Tax=Evansella sp. AB-rgal1 TaxID=3242696 RepID=UPI00359ED730
MRIYNMRTNNVTNPLGFELDNVSLSWVIDRAESSASFQSEARVEISLSSGFEDVLFDSGKKKEMNRLCYQPDLILHPRTRYYWRVTVWGENEEVGVSEAAWFETGKIAEEWQAKWISPNLPSDIHPIIRRPFEIKKEVVNARMYITGLGLYDLELNGKKVGSEYLAPGFHSYDFWLQYQTYDITKDLKQGKNALGIMLGNGWYKGRFGFGGGYENIYGDSFSFIAEMHLRYKDGTSEVVVTDDTWKCMQAPITFSGIYDGEVYDANKEESLWSSPELEEEPTTEVYFNKDSFPKLQGRYSLPVKIMEEIKPLKVIQTPAGETVLDFGQNMTGWVKFASRAKKGVKQKLEYGEILQEGNFYNKNLRSAKAQYTYISNGEKREVQPKFTFYGFRYVRLEGFGECPDIKDFTGCVVYSEMEKTGFIKTSNPLVNKLFENVMWGQKGNFLDVPTDCPQRDERMGWTGDAQIFASTACFNMYSPAFFKKYMFDLRKEQQYLQGSVPFIVPAIKPKGVHGFVMGHGSTAWADAATIIPWMVYLHYGNKQLLQSQFDTMKDWVEYMKSLDEETGGKRLLKKGIHLGDWLALDGEDPAGRLGGTDQFYIASACYYYSTNIVSKAAYILGKESDGKKYAQLATEIKDAMNKEYITTNGRLAINTQTGLILALYMDLIYEDYKPRVIDDLKRKLIDNNMYLKTGFVGTPYFCHALSNYAGNEYAYSLLLNEDYPSWIYSIHLGATTIWERWNSVLEDGSISGTGMNSLNHYAYGSIVDWMYQHMCGIRPNEDYPGYRQFTLEPKPDGRIEFVEASFESASGTIKSGWKIRKDQEIVFTFSVPFDTKADLILPNASVDDIKINGESASYVDARQHGENVITQLTAGDYEIIYPLPRTYVKKYSIDSTLRELLINGKTRKIIQEDLQYHYATQELYKGELLDIPLREIRANKLISSYVTQKTLEDIGKKLERI